MHRRPSVRDTVLALLVLVVAVVAVVQPVAGLVGMLALVAFVVLGVLVPQMRQRQLDAAAPRQQPAVRAEVVAPRKRRRRLRTRDSEKSSAVRIDQLASGGSTEDAPSCAPPKEDDEDISGKLTDLIENDETVFTSEQIRAIKQRIRNEGINGIKSRAGRLADEEARRRVANDGLVEPLEARKAFARDLLKGTRHARDPYLLPRNRRKVAAENPRVDRARLEPMLRAARQTTQVK